MFGAMHYALVAKAAYEAERYEIDHARARLTPEQFKEWQAERVAERRHRELCASIESAGERARPRGLGLFW